MRAVRQTMQLIDGLIYLLIGPFTVVGTVPLLLLQIETAMGLPNFTSAGIATTGFLLMDLGGLLALWCSWLMYRSGGSPIPSAPAVELVRSWPYSQVRHPMMHSLLLVGIGELLVTGSLLILLWIPIAMRAGVLFITSYEEPALLARFKDEYAAYCERVPRWLPKR